jgi:hypothetical protein
LWDEQPHLAALLVHQDLRRLLAASSWLLAKPKPAS